MADHGTRIVVFQERNKNDFLQFCQNLGYRYDCSKLWLCIYNYDYSKWLLLLDMVEFVGKGSQFFLLICAVLWLQVRKKWVAWIIYFEIWAKLFCIVKAFWFWQKWVFVKYGIVQDTDPNYCLYFGLHFNKVWK